MIIIIQHFIGQSPSLSLSFFLRISRVSNLIYEFQFVVSRCLKYVDRIVSATQEVVIFHSGSRLRAAGTIQEMSSRGFSVEDSDEENDYENHVTRKPNRFRKSYYDEDDDDNDVNGRYIRSNSRRNHRDDNDEDEPRYSRQSSNVRRSGENFVPKSLDRDREYDQNTRSVRQPTTAWASGRREDRSDTDPDNGRSWNRAAPRGDRRDSNPDKRASWRAPSDDEDDRPRSRNGYHQSSERPNRPPPRGDRPVNNYSRRNYDEEDSPNQYGGVREESRSRSNSNSHRPPPREYSEDENDYNRTPHQSHQQIVRRPQREFESTRESTPTIDDDLLSDDGNGADHIKQEHDLHDRQVVDVAGVMRLGNSISFVSLCPANGGTTDLVQCVILRDRMNLVEGTLYPTYKLYLENKMKLLITAQKMNLNTTSNYHLFDMTRGTLGGTLSKKSGNYLGKLRAHDSHR